MVWDELSMEWSSDVSDIEISGNFNDLVSAQKSVIEVNKIWDKMMTGDDYEEDEEEESGWIVKSVNKVSDLSKVTPGSVDKSQAKSEQEQIEYATNEGETLPIFTQDKLSGPGWVAVARSDRGHLSIVLVQP